jgi:hypothetical protein
MGSKVMSDFLLELPKSPEKEVFTVRNGDKYFGVITGENSLYVLKEEFDSPLRASNHARSLKRQHKIKTLIKNEKNTFVTTNTFKLLRNSRLYTEAEMASQTGLKFREVWIIVSPKGEFVSTMLSDQTVVTYVKDKDLAKTYRTYEEAILNLKTLDMVVKRGHSLRRFFERNDRA